jgi:hypothetical protein
MDGQPRMVTAGVHDLDAATYHQDPAPQPSLSSTLARLILDRSPLHAWTSSPRLNPAWEPVEKTVFDIGRAAHRAVLGKGADYVAYPADLLAANGAASTKDAKAWADEHRAAGRTPLKADQVDAIDAMAVAVIRRLQSMGIEFDRARSELSAIAQIDGIWCRAMIDQAPHDPRAPLYDLKSCEDASPEAVVASVARYGYDVQAAHYLAVWKAATGEDRRFRFVFVEKAPPHEVAVVELYRKPGDDADWFDHADAAAADARRIWGECLRSGVWPGYPSRVAVIGAPGWHNARMGNRAAMRPAPAAKPDTETLARAAQWQAP